MIEIRELATIREKLSKKMLLIASIRRKVAYNSHYPEIQQLIKTSNVLEAARKIIDPTNIRISDGLKKLSDAELPQSIFKQFASDLQLKDLLAKAEALVAKANLTFAKTVSKDTIPTEPFTNDTPSKESTLKESGFKENAIEGSAFEENGI